MSNNKNSSLFPDPNAEKSKKDTEEFGLQLGRAILGRTSEYRERRNAIFSLNRMFANGRQPIQPYLDQMDVDGKDTFTNIRFKPRPIAQKFHNIVVDGYGEKNEKPNARSLSKHIQDRKEKRRTDAMFRMDFKNELDQLSQEAGVPLVDPNEFVPESKEELDIYMELNDKEKEELLMQQMIDFTLGDNNIKEKKRRFLSNIFINNLAGFYNYLDTNGRLQVEVIDGEDCVYAHSIKDDFSDSSYLGRIMRMSVSEARARFKLTPDKERLLFENAQKCNGKYNNPVLRSWTDDWRYATERPYDSHTVEVFHFWWKCSKVLSYVEGTDRFGREVFDITYNLEEPKKPNPRKQKGYVTPQTSYEGFMLINSPCMLQWGESKNILRKGEDKAEVMSPFIMRMPNNDGYMLTPSAVNNMIDSIEVMDLAILQMKNIMAKAAPDGLAIDVMGLADMDLGEGIGIVDPLTIGQIYRRTGDIYYNSRTEEGGQNQVPVAANLSPFSNKLSTFLEIYNSELAKIRDYLGVNEFRDGSATNPRTGFRFAQSQLDSSNTATIYIYNSYISSGNELIKQIGQRIWDSLVYGTPNKGYLGFIGKANAEMLKKRDDITASSYDFNFKLEMDEQQKQLLDSYIQTCLANGSLEMPDAITLMEIDDLKLASRMLTHLYNKRRKEKMEEAQENQKSAADYSAQAGVAVEKARQQTEQLSLQGKMGVEKERGNQDRDKELEKLAWELIKGEAEGRPIPPKYVGLVDLVLQNRGIGLNIEADMKAMEAEQLAMQQEAIMMGQEGQMA